MKLDRVKICTVFIAVLAISVWLASHTSMTLSYIENNSSIETLGFNSIKNSLLKHRAQVLGESITNTTKQACNMSACLIFNLKDYSSDSKTYIGTLSVILLNAKTGSIFLNNNILYPSINYSEMSVDASFIPGSLNRFVFFSHYNPTGQGIPTLSMDILIPEALNTPKTNTVSKCVYPSAPDKCSYVPGDSYDPINNCGKVLSCQASFVAPTPTTAPTATPTPLPTYLPIATPNPTEQAVSRTPVFNPNYYPVVIKAYGTPAFGAYPIMQLGIGDKVFASWDVDGNIQDYLFNSPDDLSGQNLRISFINDAYNPPYEDRNLFVESISFGGKTYYSSDAQTYSSGGWGSDGCAAGYKKAQWLYCKGYFEFGNVNRSQYPPSNVKASYWLHPGFSQLSSLGSPTDPYLDKNNWGDVLDKTNVYSFFLEDVANFKRYDNMANLKKRLNIIGNKDINIEWWSLRTGAAVKACSPAADSENAADVDWDKIPECKNNQSSAECVGKISGIIDLKRMQPIYDFGRNVSFYTMDNPIQRVMKNSKSNPGTNNFCNFSLEDSILATTEFMKIIHKERPEIKFNMYVALPNSWYNGIPPWAFGAEPHGHGDLDYKDILTKAVSGINQSGESLYALHVDNPYNYIVPQSGSNDNRKTSNQLQKVLEIEKQARSLGLKFGLVFNSDTLPNSSSASAIFEADEKYAQDTYEYINKFISAGGRADNVIIESWYFKNIDNITVYTPNKTFPASQKNTFLYIAGKAFDLYKSLVK